MTKVKISVVTELVFNSVEDFEEYCKSDYQANITGFADELKEAWLSGKQLKVETNRPKIGAVTASYIEAKEFRDWGFAK